MVRLLHISDVHCSKEKLKDVLAKESFDLLVLSGDLQCYDLLDLLENVKDKMVAVTGNMDDISLAKKMKDWGVLIDGELIEKESLKLAGIGGLDPITSLRELEKNYQQELQFIYILVSHHPPKGAVDRSFFGIRAGLDELRDFIKKYKPRLHLCGHIHEARGKEKIEDTLVVNAGPLKRGYYAIIEINDKIIVKLRRLI